METVRAFIAVDIGDEIRSRLDTLQRSLQRELVHVRWVEPCNIHLTLLFLGDLPSDRLEFVTHRMDACCTGQPAFDLHAMGTGFFGRPESPRVVWAGIATCASLMQLQAHLVQGLHHTGNHFDRKPFTPHLTLGRIKGVHRAIRPIGELLEPFSETNLGTSHIGEVQLVRSELTPHGAEYSVLHVSPLSEAFAAT